MKINSKQHITKKGVVKKNPISKKLVKESERMIKTIEQAISLLRERGIDVDDIKRFNWEVDEEMMTDKQLIDFANDQIIREIEDKRWKNGLRGGRMG